MAAKKSKMGRPMGRTQDAAIHFRVDAATLTRLDALVASVDHLGIHRSGVLRACLLHGLDAAEKDVMRVLVATSTRGRKR
jgi:hypothetical protein